MIPSVFALIVLAVGLILIHFGLTGLETQLGQIANAPIPPPSYGKPGGLGY